MEFVTQVSATRDIASMDAVAPQKPNENAIGAHSLGVLSYALLTVVVRAAGEWTVNLSSSPRGKTGKGDFCFAGAIGPIVRSGLGGE